jgi:hypothetical protein
MRRTPLKKDKTPVAEPVRVVPEQASQTVSLLEKQRSLIDLMRDSPLVGVALDVQRDRSLARSADVASDED